jgi:hypothetical protein
VNCVAPGIAPSTIGQETANSRAPDYARGGLLFGDFPTPDEIARCTLSLVRRVADLITSAKIDSGGSRDLRCHSCGRRR